MNWDEVLERVRSAANFCASAGLARFRIAEDELDIDVHRTPGRAAAPPAARTLEAAAHHSGSNGSTPKEELPKTLKAEFVGIVRFSRPSVAAGSVVSGDRELAYVESLGIRNPVRSGGPCRVTEIFVKDGQPVGFGQPLLAIEPQRV